MDKSMFLLSKLSESIDICICGYDKNTLNEELRLNINKGMVIQKPSLVKDLHGLYKDCTFPVVQPDTPEVAYGVFNVKNLFYVIGPANIGNLERWELQEYALSKGIEFGSFNAPTFDRNKFEAFVLLCYGITSGDACFSVEWHSPLNPPIEIKKLTMFYHDSVQNYVEQGFERLDYYEELRFTDAIRKGDHKSLTNLNLSKLMDNMGIFSSNPMKQREYSACVILTLATRAALWGGINPKKAMDLQDLGLKYLANCKTEADIILLCGDAIRGLAYMVAENMNKDAQASYIEKAKQYILAHLSTPFTLDQLAYEIGFNPQYLSRRFKKIVGLSFKQYTQNMRLDAAANMLRFTDTPISTIAGKFCYPSQSHFCKVFKERFGVTPLKYRIDNLDH